MQFSGAAVLSADSVWRLVENEAQRLDLDQFEAIAQSASLLEPTYIAADDVYRC